MKQINNVLKTLLIIFSMLGFSANAWGKYDRSWKATVGVGTVKGKGTVSVQMYTKVGIEYSGDSQRTSSSKVSVSDSQSAYLSTSLINHLCKYSVVSEDDGYAFAGWFSNEACTGNPESTQRTDWVGHSATTNSWDVTYWAKFIPVTVNSVTATSSTLYFTEPGTKLDTLTFSVSNADAKADFNTPTISNSEWTLTSWNYSSNKVTVIVSFTVTNATDKTSNHATTVTLTSKGTSEHQSQTANLSVSLNMNPKFTYNIKGDYFVDDAAINLATMWTSTSNGSISYTIENWTPSSTINAGATEPKIVNKMLSLGQAGTVKLKLTQAASVSFNAGEDEIKTITINKRDNAISNTYKWRDENHTVWSERLSFETGAYVRFSSNNQDAGAPQIDVIAKTGTEYATFWPASETQDENGDFFWASWNIGVATWEVSQAENYKYKAATAKTFKIIVNVNDDPTKCSCNLYSESHDWGDERTASEIDSIGFGGIGDSLYFDMVKNLAAGNVAKYSLYTDGNWSGTTNVAAKSEYSYTHFGPIDLTLNGNTTAVKFAKSHSQEWWQWDTDDPYINNIKVTRKRWLMIKDKAGKSAKEITSLPQMKRYIDDDTVKVTFYVDFSTCDKLVKVASSYDHVTFRNKLTKDTASYNTAPVTTRGYSDKVAVTVYYYSDEVEETTVTITIFTEFEIKTITIPVKTEGYVFIGTKDDQWTEAKNWNVGRVPNANHDVIIESNAVVEDEMAVRSMDITTGSVTIAPTGGLTIGKGGISGATKDNLILKAGTEGKIKGETGYLRISPEYVGTMPEATVELFSLGYYNMNSEEENVAAWQYVGVPVESSALAKTFFKSSWIYSWIEEDGEWQNNRSKLVMNPFEGYATTQYKSSEGLLVTFAGLITAGKEYVAPVAANGETEEQGCNVLANSFTAPIDITKFDTKDFSNGVEATIYLFNTGSRKDATAKRSVDEEDDAENAPGQYIAIPVANVEPLKAAYKELPTVIAPMQGFCVKTTKAGTVTLNYERLVWDGNYKEHPNTPLHLPRKAINTSTLGSLCIAVSANGWSDKLFMLESESYDKAYEMGYDALKMASGELNIFAVEEDKQLAVDATNNMVGTYIGVRTGAETIYSLTFSHVISEHDLLLFDSETNEVLDIADGLDYTFTAEPNAIITERFRILEREKSPEVTTAIDKADVSSVKVKKFIKDNQLYILKNGVLYNATGARVH